MGRNISRACIRDQIVGTTETAELPAPNFYVLELPKFGILRAPYNALVAQKVQIVTNTLYYGDNLQILRDHIADESVDLVYLDPPFKSNQDYNVLFSEQDGTRAAAQMKAFEDTWTWDQVSVKLTTTTQTTVSTLRQEKSQDQRTWSFPNSKLLPNNRINWA